MPYKDLKKRKQYQKVYSKIWRLNNPVKAKGYQKKCYLKNREKIVLRAREYRKLNPEYQHQYYMKNRVNKRAKMNSQVIAKYGSFANKLGLLRQRNLMTWESYLPLVTQCQVCGKNIYFHQKNRADAIHFDHRNGGGEQIKKPFQWLCHHPFNEKNKAIWESCDFGLLCSKCNVRLPTKDREQFVENVLQYIKNKQETIRRLN